MFVGELIARRNDVVFKIKELKRYLNSLPSDKAGSKGSIYKECLDRIFSLTEKYQSYSLLLNRSNNKTTIAIGESDEVNVESALVLVSTINNKIIVIEDVIDNPDHSIDIFTLMQQRDALVEELIILQSAIYRSDWNTEVE
jgi:hypothetical protein